MFDPSHPACEQNGNFASPIRQAVTNTSHGDLRLTFINHCYDANHASR